MLIDGPDTVEVFVEEASADGDGTPVRRPVAEPVTVPGRWQFESSADGDEGSPVRSSARFLCRSFPAGFAGTVRFGGRFWDVVGEPAPRGLSSLTSHVVVRLAARSPGPVA